MVPKWACFRCAPLRRSRLKRKGRQCDVRLVLFSDLHLDRPFKWAGPVVGRKLRTAIRDTLERICELVTEERADALLCAGDLYEQALFKPDTIAFLQRIFSEIAPISVFIAPGNHDWYGPESLYAKAQWSPNVHVFREQAFAPVNIGDEVTLWGIAHTRPECSRDFLRGFEAPAETLNLALFHGSEQTYLAAQIAQDSNKVAHAPFREAEIRQARLTHAFVGHYHLPKDTEWLTYPGTPQPLAFGEGAGGAVIVDLAEGRIVDRRRVQVSSIQFHDLVLDVTGASDAAEVRRRVGTLTGDLRGVARITVSGEIRPDIDLRLSEIMGSSSEALAIVARRGNAHEAYDLDVIAREPTIPGQFITDVRNSDLLEEEKERVVTVGLRALAGRHDLEPL